MAVNAVCPRRSLSNEPEVGGPNASLAVDYFQQLLDHTRGADPQRRLVTVEGDNSLEFHRALDLDISSVHGYPGWCD